MQTKLTLRMDEKIIETAKIYARKQGTSLSKLVADYLQMISTKSIPSQSRSSIKPTPILAEITGVLRKTPRRKDLRKDYHQYLEGKYL